MIIESDSLQLISLLGLGLMLGIKHALEADHIAAISTIVSKTRSIKISSILGAFWGLGHTATLLIVGFAVLIFKLQIPVNFSLGFEFLAGFMLTILGLDVFRTMRKEKIHFHDHAHENRTHGHFHPHSTTLSHDHIHKPFFVGMLHGLAGSAALTLLVLATVKSTLEGLLYIAVFGVGSIAGMFLISTAIAIPFSISGQFTSFEKSIKIVAGATSIILGGIIMYQIGYKNGLLF